MRAMTESSDYKVLEAFAWRLWMSSGCDRIPQAILVFSAGVGALCRHAEAIQDDAFNVKRKGRNLSNKILKKMSDALAPVPTLGTDARTIVESSELKQPPTLTNLRPPPVPAFSLVCTPSPVRFFSGFSSLQVLSKLCVLRT